MWKRIQPIPIATFCFIALVVFLEWHGFWWDEYISASYIQWNSPPHILTTLSLLGVSIGCFIFWYQKKKKLSLILGWSAFLAPVVFFVFHRYWDTQFGAFDRGSLCVYWCPPHLIPLITFALLGSLLFLLLRKESSSHVLHVFLLAAIAENIFFQLRPFRPTGHVLAVVDFWGAGVLAAAFVFYLFAVHSIVKKKWSTVWGVIGVFCIRGAAAALGIAALLYFDKTLPPIGDIFWGGYRHPPVFLLITTTLLVAFILQATAKLPQWLIFAISSTFYSFILYGVGRAFIHQDYLYSDVDIVIACISSCIGGIFASLLFSFCENRISHYRR